MVKSIRSHIDPTASSIATLVAASLAALGLAYIVPGGAAAPVASSEITGSIAPAPAIWQISNDLSGETCIARPGPRISNGAHSLALDENCTDVHDALPAAAVWYENLDGIVSLTDASGRVLVSFAQADGIGLEAFEPAQVMLSLERL